MSRQREAGNWVKRADGAVWGYKRVPYGLESCV